MPDLIWFEWGRYAEGYSLETLGPGKISFIHDPQEDYHFVGKVAEDAPAWFHGLVNKYKDNDDWLHHLLAGQSYPGGRFWDTEADKTYPGGQFFVPVGKKLSNTSRLKKTPACLWSSLKP